MGNSIIEHQQDVLLFVRRSVYTGKIEVANFLTGEIPARESDGRIITVDNIDQVIDEIKGGTWS